MTKPPESQPRPVPDDHIEGPHGVELPARIVFPPFLEWKQAGFNFWQQPPFTLVELQLESADWEPFIDEVSPFELSRLLILMATRHLVTSSVLDEAGMQAIGNARRRDGIYNRLANEYLEHFGSTLKPEVATALASKVKGDQEKRKVALVQVVQIVEKVRAYLARHLFCFRYIEEMVGKSGKNFFLDGSVNVTQNPPHSQAQISSYVGYRDTHSKIAGITSAPWIGLPEELPSDGE